MSIFLKKGSRVQVGFPSEVTPFHLMVDDLLFMYIIMKYIEAFHGFLYIFYSSLARVLLNLIIKKSHIYIHSIGSHFNCNFLKIPGTKRILISSNGIYTS